MAPNRYKLKKRRNPNIFQHSIKSKIINKKFQSKDKFKTVKDFWIKKMLSSLKLYIKLSLILSMISLFNCRRELSSNSSFIIIKLNSSGRIFR